MQDDFDCIDEEREEIRRAYAPMSRDEQKEFVKRLMPSTSYERGEDRATRLIAEAYGMEWLKSVSYDGVKAKSNAYIWRYAAMEELGIPLTPEIRRAYGSMISEFREHLPRRIA